MPAPQLLFLLLFCVLLAACEAQPDAESAAEATEPSPEETPSPSAAGTEVAALIVGTWESVDLEVSPTFEYGSDGTLKMSLGPDFPPRLGTYAFEDEETLVITWAESPDPAKKTHTLTVTVTQDELTTTDANGRVDRFKRLE